jgi:hypothetical protein
MHVRRFKHGDPGAAGLEREQVPASRFAFTNERGSTFTPDGIGKLVGRAGRRLWRD